MSSSAPVNDPALPAAQMHLVKPKAPVSGRVVSSELCLKGKSSSYIRHVAIDVSGTPLAGNTLPGQSFGIIPPGVDERGKPHAVRLYSLASPSFGEDGNGNIIATTSKRLIDERSPQSDQDDPLDHRLFLGVCSNYVCDLKVGDEVLVSGPNGKSFLLPEHPDDHDFLFIATGTGIAPFRAMAMELYERGGTPASRVHVVMGAPYTSDLLYDDLFRRYAAEHPGRFHYHTAISREPIEGRSRGMYVDEYVARNMDATFAEFLANPRTLVYVCGIKGMETGLFRSFAKYGYAGAYLTFRDEGLAATDPDTWDNAAIRRGVRPSRRCMLEVY